MKKKYSFKKDSFKVVLSNTKYLGKDESSMSEKQYEKSEPCNKKHSWQLCLLRWSSKNGVTLWPDSRVLKT